MISVMKVDATPSSRPVVDSVSTSGEIAEMFDTITYDKVRQRLAAPRFYCYNR